MATKKPAAPQSSLLPTDRKGVRGEGFDHTTGGFARVWIDGVSYDVSEVRRRVNQGPAFDALMDAVENSLCDLEPHGAARVTLSRTGIKVTAEVLRAALKLAKEVK